MAAERRSKLVFEEGGETVEFELEKSPLTIGRAKGCDVALRDTSVSRCHAELSRLWPRAAGRPSSVVDGPWEARKRVREIAAKCRLNLEHLRRFPHAFSGGQRQRISIARALVCNPRFIVADESVAALDVSIQADILNLLQSLKNDLGLTFLFISHDLSVVAHTCDMVAVMYLGTLVESAPTRTLFAEPRHPYTRALLSAIPSLDPDDRGTVQKLEGEIPSPVNPPSGCKFHTRCPHAIDVCKTEVPVLEQSEAGHMVKCHRWQELIDAMAPATA